ncbi:hypothetical protein CRP01_24515 [Flavilitoribacter nigricans DSM 23189 = NBRC 102662]|uniref:Uncharacterized protein n=1 Tax=Flavilitoribacter nigricans (strain ATCC 23147 / DSM 23189 / NBRC 102662 / NCIMB 1420 / SS-2) TaxID=1122177 RepID=A0A2D0N5D9_FLAN2|nr:hypothetical protein CRP01_24515 [Flavilitoribacter nigricans DSM 23189 = NBRC 102662]
MLIDFGPQKWGILPRFYYRLWELLLFGITLYVSALRAVLGPAVRVVSQSFENQLIDPAAKPSISGNGLIKIGRPPAIDNHRLKSERTFVVLHVEI